MVMDEKDLMKIHKYAEHMKRYASAIQTLVEEALDEQLVINEEVWKRDLINTIDNMDNQIFFAKVMGSDVYPIVKA